MQHSDSIVSSADCGSVDGCERFGRGHVSGSASSNRGRLTGLVVADCVCQVLGWGCMPGMVSIVVLSCRSLASDLGRGH
jgi:hypothetical protein